VWRKLRNAQNLVGKPEEERVIGRVGSDGKIISKLILTEPCVRVWAKFIWL
jgi:hypothetical protein